MSRTERVRVFCRVRPLLQREREGWSYEEYAQQVGEETDDSSPVPTLPTRENGPSAFLTDKTRVPLDSSVLTVNADQKSLTLSPPDTESREFSFDASLHEGTSQEAMYHRVAYDIVQDVMEGYNGTILAYGQTSTGKTYTMLGKDNDLTGDHRGIVPRALEDIFERVHATHQTIKTSIALSYVQIYCERIFDLLSPDAPPGSLMVREDAERGGVYLDGAATVAVTNVADCMKLVARGNANRATASTGMNIHSSRSHAVLIARIERKEYTSAASSASPSATHCVKLSTLFLVDLAGSERVKKAKVYGRHVSELKAINLSLSALGNCISALSKQQPQRHVPYRDSKLTRLLSSSLGGNAKTSLVVTVSPSPTETQETLSTLQFGQRAMRVLVQAHQNVLSVMDYKSLYEETQQRLDESRASNQQLAAELESKKAAHREVEDKLHKAQLRIQHLEFECQAAKMYSTPQETGVSGSATPRVILADQIASLVRQRDEVIATIQEKCDLQVETYRRLAEEAQHEWHELEDQLANEKQQVLASLQELKDFKMRFFELEDSSTDRIAELVSDESEKEREHRYEKELLQQQVTVHESNLQELQRKLDQANAHAQQLQEQMEVDYVPKEAIKQMEMLYESAISKLQSRVGSLEQRSSSLRKLQANTNQDSELAVPQASVVPVAAKNPLRAVVAPPPGKAIPKVSRIVPASRANSLR